jgi:hypothetical protein
MSYYKVALRPSDILIGPISQFGHFLKKPKITFIGTWGKFFVKFSTCQNSPLTLFEASLEIPTQTLSFVDAWISMNSNQDKAVASRAVTPVQTLFTVNNWSYIFNHPCMF